MNLRIFPYKSFKFRHTVCLGALCESRRIASGANSRRWSCELFRVNQSILLFSWNSAQVSRDETCMGGNETPLLDGGIRHNYDASVSGAQTLV